MVDTIDQRINALTIAADSLERHANSWAIGLLAATVVLGVGIIFEIWSDILEVRAEHKKGQKLKFRTKLLFFGSVMVMLAVAAEGYTEWRTFEAETKARTVTAQAETLLREKADNAATDAETAIEAYGGLHQAVTHLADNAAADKATLLALDRDRAALDKARTDAEAADSRAQATLAAVRREHEGRTLTAKQQADLIQNIRGAVPSVLMRWVENDPDSYEYAKTIGDTISKAGVTIQGYNPWGLTGMLMPNRGDPEVIILEWGDGAVVSGDKVAAAFRAAGIPVSVNKEDDDWNSGAHASGWRVDILVTSRQPTIPSEGP